MDLGHLSDRTRLRLAVVGVVLLVVVAAMAAVALLALGQGGAAGAAFGISAAAVVPALVGSAVLFPSSSQPLLNIALRGVTAVTRCSRMVSRPFARLATLLRSRMAPAHG